MARHSSFQDVRHVVWDWNGTLLDDHEHCIQVMNGMLQDEGLPQLDLQRYRAVFDFPVRNYYERLGFVADSARWPLLAARFIHSYEDGVGTCKLHDGAPELLDMLSDQGIECSILSAAHQAGIEHLLQHYSVRDKFTDVVGLDDHYAGGKVEAGLAWSRRRGIDLSSTLLVGDTVHDFEVATAMNVRCVLVASGHQSRERLERCGCPVVGTLNELR